MNTDKDTNPNKDLGTQGAENKVKGRAKEVGGKIQKKVGQMTGDTKTEAKGKAREVGGKVQAGTGEAERKVDKALDS